MSDDPIIMQGGPVLLECTEPPGPPWVVVAAFAVIALAVYLYAVL